MEWVTQISFRVVFQKSSACIYAAFPFLPVQHARNSTQETGVPCIWQQSDEFQNTGTEGTPLAADIVDWTLLQT